MSRTMKSVIFLALAFAISWTVAIGGHYARLAQPLDGTTLLRAMMAGPAIAALICAFAFDKNGRMEALGLRFAPNWWWFAAWAAPILLTLGAVAFTLLLSDRAYVDLGQSIVATVEARIPEKAAQVRAIPHLGLIQFGAAVTINAVISGAILTFTEELGWRGYLYNLWRPSGFWRTALATGAIWGVWHAPAILLYGLNYPENRELGVALFTLYCVLLAPIVTLVRERSGSVWAAGLFHGTFNAVGPLSLGMISNPTFPWNGVVGIGGFIALAIGVCAVALLQRGAEVNHGKESVLPSA